MRENVVDPHRSETRVNTNGISLRVLAWTPAGPPRQTAVLLHGYMDAAATWSPVAGSLRDAGLRVLAPDLRGYGDSDRAPEGTYYHFPDYVADVAGLLRALSPGTPCLLVGHSMGGTIATLYAGAFPENVARLALLEGVGPPGSDFSSMPERMRTWIQQVDALRRAGSQARRIGSADDALRRLSANHPGVPAEILTAHLTELVSSASEGQVAWKADALHKPVSPMPFFAEGYMAFARRVSCPVLYVGGGPRGFAPPDTEERLACFARLERFELSDAGHMMHWTRAAEVAAKLLAFFD